MESPKEVLIQDDDTETLTGNKVTLFNDSIHTFEEVTEQIMKATGATEKQAFKMAYLADLYGSTVVYQGSPEECTRVSSILESIGLYTEIG